MAKEKQELPPPFTAHACERLRSLMALRNKQVTKKANATASRDSLMEAIGECSDGEVQKIAKLKVECFDEERAIEKANKAIKTCEAKVYETIEKGDEPTLFELLRRLLRIDADGLSPQRSSDCFFATVPTPTGNKMDLKSLVRDQRSRGGVAAIWGKVPAEESDEEFLAAVAELD